MHISSQRLYNFRPQFPDQVLNPFETFMSPAENVNMAMFFLKFWAWQAKFAPKKHLDSFWALPTNLPLMSISSSLLTRKRRPPPQLSIILQLRSLLWVLRCHSLPVACNEKVQAGNDLTHPQCALANGWKLQPVGAMQPQQGLGHTWSDEVCAGEISSTDLTCAPSLQMAPRKGKTQKQEEQVSLGPQVAEGENVFGVAHIFASFNDTFVHITDLSGKWVHSILSPFPKGTHNRSWHTNSASVPSSSHENWFKFVLRNDVVVNLSSFVDKESCGATPLLVQFSSNNNEAMLGDRLRREISAESTAEIGTSKYCSILGITLWYWTPNFLSSRGTESWGNFQSLWNTGGGGGCQGNETTAPVPKPKDNTSVSLEEWWFEELSWHPPCRAAFKRSYLKQNTPIFNSQLSCPTERRWCAWRAVWRWRLTVTRRRPTPLCWRPRTWRSAASSWASQRCTSSSGRPAATGQWSTVKPLLHAAQNARTGCWPKNFAA